MKSDNLVQLSGFLTKDVITNEKKSFEMPRKNADTGYYELSWEIFYFIMSGVSLESVQFRKRYRTQFICR